jgi:hypothetical protein
MFKNFSLLLIVILCTIYTNAQSGFITAYSDNQFNPTIRPYGCTQSKDGNFLIVATAKNPQTLLGSLLIIKINMQGDTIWTNYYDLIYETPRTITAAQDSGDIIGGDRFILKINANGNVDWLKQISYSEITS